MFYHEPKGTLTYMGAKIFHNTLKMLQLILQNIVKKILDETAFHSAEEFISFN